MGIEQRLDAAVAGLLALHAGTPGCRCAMCVWARWTDGRSVGDRLDAMSQIVRTHMHGPVTCWCPMCFTARMPIRQGGRYSDRLPPNPRQVFDVPEPVVPPRPRAPPVVAPRPIRARPLRGFWDDEDAAFGDD